MERRVRRNYILNKKKTTQKEKWILRKRAFRMVCQCAIFVFLDCPYNPPFHPPPTHTLKLPFSNPLSLVKWMDSWQTTHHLMWRMRQEFCLHLSKQFFQRFLSQSSCWLHFFFFCSKPFQSHKDPNISLSTTPLTHIWKQSALLRYSVIRLLKPTLFNT